MAQHKLFFQERQLTTNSQTKSILNIPKALAAVNRKNYQHIDGKGYLQTYICRVEIVSTDVLSYLYTVPENWVAKNAVRKWHAFRMQRRAQDGVLPGTYGRDIRPLLHSGHQDYANSSDYYELKVQKQTGNMTGGEWDYTQVAHTVGLNSQDNTTGVTAEELADRYYLTLTGRSVLDSGAHTTAQHNKYTHVSMMESYLQSRRNMSVDSTAASGSVLKDNNPLNEFITDSASSRMVNQLAQDEQRQKPPYETIDTSEGTADDVIPHDAVTLTYGGVLRTTSTYGRDSAVVRAPGGLIEVWSQGQGATPIPFWNVEVLGVVRSEG